jgi:hypothetical protein
MRWSLLYLRRGDVMSVLFVVIVLGVVVVGFYLRPNSLPNGGNGFGPEWDCTANGRSDRFVLKRLTPIVDARDAVESAPVPRDRKNWYD